MLHCISNHSRSQESAADDELELMYETGRGVVAVIPTYCEVESFARFALTRIHQVLPELSVLIVDDSSPDGTGEWVHER